ncbi:SDR family oxidoreductase [Pseudoteredinibacter isoporae]|uniref:NAD(P)-dependent dehydrogenase (Short-subunit alcohol dehydrogenase family) n=1 Tax=Pseudoteredinibacter isoporae TaxID=570281 RepID=A0A7X0JU37_9GAMM|nr:SDR family oxidoreductase [Pseudoteredinibacter isoporae]MBB6522305.1 NAD(P)-dependent dehydrogenase (short-subunit alcohol dehydrogenase family) [Pseudoteredinibacter isoporae]NHO87838.1 SDR family oxidoreductase [Pseudoteredinibacter isoporae]NIB23831.1 SDR family oxidoreductase [Pseudoteredinibacter isoporae]
MSTSIKQTASSTTNPTTTPAAMPVKTVVITGASSGFGRLACKAFQKAGWNVAATMRSPERENELNTLRNVQLFPLDVCDRQSIESTITSVMETFGRIDCLINNAGYGAFGFLEEASEEEIMQQMNTNFLGVINTTQAVLPYMRKQKEGSIINVTSLAGLMGMPMLSLYSASKFAVEGLTESLSHELAEFGIRVHLIEPGAFKTGFSSAYSFNEGQATPELNRERGVYKKFLDNMLAEPPKPFGYGDPQDVASLMLKIAQTPKSPLRNVIGKDGKSLMLTQKLLGKKRLLKVIGNAAMPKLSA